MPGQDGWLWEERWTSLRPGALAAYRDRYLQRVWPALEARGVRPLGLFNAMIGAPAEETLSVTGYESLAAYDQLQRELDGEAQDAGVTSIKSERVRLLRSSGVRPAQNTGTADRRPLYGVRHFSIAARDWDAFVRSSAEGVWPRIESQGAAILGMFRDLATVQPLDVLLLTGYHGAAHWEATRGGYPRPDTFPEEEWRRAGEVAALRPPLVQRSAVWLMRAHWPA